jgi:hypothetical protein
VPVGDVYRLVITAAGGTHFYQNTFALSQELETDLSNSHFASFVTDWITAIKAGQATSIIYQSWAATQVWGDGMSVVASECRREGGRAFGDVITGQAGTSVGDLLPPQAATVVSLISGQVGKRKRGRIYLFGQIENNQADGLLTAPYTSTLGPALTTFFNLYKSPTGTSPNFTLGIWSERTASGCVPATPPQKGHVNVNTPHPELAFTPCTGYILRPVVYTQRRRTRGVGF